MARYNIADLYAEVFGKPVEVEIPQVINQGLLEALSTLPKRTRLAVTQRYFEGKTLKEAAAVFPRSDGGTGIATERVRQIISKGLRQLRHPKRTGHLQILVNPVTWRPAEEWALAIGRCTDIIVPKLMLEKTAEEAEAFRLTAAFFQKNAVRDTGMVVSLEYLTGGSWELGHNAMSVLAAAELIQKEIEAEMQT